MVRGAEARPAFPILRWVAIGWLVVWTPSYAVVWGWRNFLQLCDIAVFLTAAGLWRGNALLLSSQAISSLVIDGLWTLDVGWRLVTERHLIGGTEYMWKAEHPLAVRLLSLFHAALPVVLLYAVKKVGHDRRALPLQAGLAAAVLVASRLVGNPDVNPNFAFRDPIWHRSWGPAALHLAAMGGILVAAVYLPTDWALRRFARRR